MNEGRWRVVAMVDLSGEAYGFEHSAYENIKKRTTRYQKTHPTTFISEKSFHLLTSIFDISDGR